MPKASKRARSPLVAPAPVTAPPLGKYLASTEKSVRDKAIKKLARFLSRADEDGTEGGGGRLSPKEMQKLWKGLFYCFWMSDKPLVQQALASELAGLVLLIDPKDSKSPSNRTLAALEFVGGFWEALVREWSGIDRLRLDKYYMLVRRFVNATMQLLQRDGWEPASIAAYNAILSKPTGGPLSPSDIRVPSSISYHLADIVLSELPPPLPTPSEDDTEAAPAAATSAFTSAAQSAPLPLLLQPFTALLLHTTSSTTHTRLLDAIYKPLLGPDEREPGGRGDLSPATRKALLGALFREAGDPLSRDVNRRKVFNFWKENGGPGADEEEGDEA